MSTNKLLIAMAVVALACAACFVVFDDTANDAADGGYTMTADYRGVIEGKPIVHLTLNAPIFASPAFVTIAGESSTGEDYELETVALFMNSAEANVEAPGLTDGQYTVTLDTKITGEVSADFRAAKAYPVTVRTSGEGTASVNPTMAYEGDTVTITATAAKDYKVKEMSYNGKVLTGTNTFTMPAAEVLVFVEFELEYVECTVTFVIAEGFSNEVTATVGEPMQAPEDPEVIGAEFEGWYTEDGVKFDFETEIEGDMTLYAHFGPEAPSTEQTTKFVANIAVDGGVCNLVTTAYDGKIIGKGTAAIGVYMMYGGNFVYIDTVKYAIDGKDVFSVDNITKEIKTIATEPGQYAVMSTVMLDSGASYITNFALYEIEAQA